MKYTDKPRIGIDLDGVLADYLGTFFKVSRKLCHKPKRNFQPTDHNMSDGLTANELYAAERECMHIRNFWRTLDKYDNTNLLSKLQDDLNLFFLTARYPTDGSCVMEQSQEWLWDNFKIRGAYVVCTDQKGKEAAELGLHAFIDDKPEYVQDVKEQCPTAYVAICDRTYNRSFDHAKHSITRVSNLNEFLRPFVPAA